MRKKSKAILTSLASPSRIFILKNRLKLRLVFPTNDLIAPLLFTFAILCDRTRLSPVFEQFVAFPHADAYCLQV